MVGRSPTTSVDPSVRPALPTSLISTQFFVLPSVQWCLPRRRSAVCSERSTLPLHADRPYQRAIVTPASLPNERIDGTTYEGIYIHPKLQQSFMTFICNFKLWWDSKFNVEAIDNIRFQQLVGLYMSELGSMYWKVGRMIQNRTEQKFNEHTCSL